MVVKHVIFSSAVPDVCPDTTEASHSQQTCGLSHHNGGARHTFDKMPSVDFEDNPDVFELLEVGDDGNINPTLACLLSSSLEAVVQRAEAEQSLCLNMGVAAGRQAPSKHKLTVFHGVRAPPITVASYIERLAKYAKCSPACFIYALAYLDHIGQDANYLPTGLSIHRLLLTATMLAIKFLDDHYFNNAFYARVGGIAVQELNRLELEMLKLLDFRLMISVDSVRHYLKQLQSGTLTLGSGENGTLAVGRKRRSVNGNGTEKRSHRRSSMDSSVSGVSGSSHSERRTCRSSLASGSLGLENLAAHDDDDDAELDENTYKLKRVSTNSEGAGWRGNSKGQIEVM